MRSDNLRIGEVAPTPEFLCEISFLYSQDDNDGINKVRYLPRLVSHVVCVACVLSTALECDGTDGWMTSSFDDLLIFLMFISLDIHRLYCKGRVLGHKRAKRNSRPNTSLLQIEGVANKEDAQFYLGKVRISSNFVPRGFY